MKDSTFTIYSAEIDNPNWTEGAELWPEGTAQQLAEALRVEFPELFVEVKNNVTGWGSGYSGSNPDAQHNCETFQDEFFAKL